MSTGLWRGTVLHQESLGEPVAPVLLSTQLCLLEGCSTLPAGAKLDFEGGKGQ